MMAAAKQLKVRLPPLPTIKEVIRLYGLRALKQLSQNFLLEEKYIAKIVKSAGHIENNVICEVGPGPGGITRSILRQNPKKVIVVEKDPRFLPSLELLADACRPAAIPMDILIGDILQTDFRRIFPIEEKKEWVDSPPKLNLIGNLPFSVSTILIVRWLEMISKREGAWEFGRTRMTLTFQKEVAERMVAPILDDQRCRLSVMCQNWCSIKYTHTLPSRAFVPRPAVEVGIVTLTPLRNPIIKLPFKLIERVVRQIFSMRQKYSIRGAQTLFPEDIREEMALKMYEMADIDPITRPFQISNHEFGRICQAYSEIIARYPEIDKYDYRAPKKNKTALSEDTGGAEAIVEYV